MREKRRSGSGMGEGMEVRLTAALTRLIVLYSFPITVDIYLAPNFLSTLSSAFSSLLE